MEVSRALEENGFEVEVVEDPTLDELEIAIEDFIFDKGADLLCRTRPYQDAGLRW